MTRRTSSTAVVGAGIAGLTCARELVDRSHDVEVFEKSRGPGGRCATRIPRDANELRFDHGAQYFTARDRRFRLQVRSWLDRGIAARWDPRLVALTQTGAEPKSPPPTRYVGLPDNAALGRDLARDLAVRYGTHVERVGLSDDGWVLVSADGEMLGAFEAVVVAVPAPQAAALLDEAAPELAVRCRAISSRPCWAVMAAFDPPLGASFDAAFVDRPSSPLAWIARDSSKPGRSDHPETWVLHGSPGWSERALEWEADDAGDHLLADFFRLIGEEPIEPAFRRAHRWRYARTAEPAEDGCWSDPTGSLVVAGDWLAGDRIEGAYRSGRIAAERSGPPTRSSGP